MAKVMSAPEQRAKRKVKMRSRMLIPILLVVVFQLVTFIGALVVGGEFRNIREYAYNTLIEKTENRGIYIQNELQEKPFLVQEYAEVISGIVKGQLAEHGGTIADLQTDKDLVQGVLEASVLELTNLLRRAVVNDAYLILDTGDLYADEGDENAKAALYLRDVDPTSGQGSKDYLMEIGFSSISQAYGLTRHSGWNTFFTPNPEDMTKYGFYYRTIQNARERPNLSATQLGYWSRFSRMISTLTPSMKYTMPLIAEDGTVYGVLGVGLTESNVLSNIPSYDFLNETACYVLGLSTGDWDTFDILSYSGSSFVDLLGHETTLQIHDKDDDGIYEFNKVTKVDLAGSVQYMEMYSRSSPYADEQWALISVADRASVLRPLNYLKDMLGISALVSLFVAMAVAVISCSGLIKPIAVASQMMKDKKKGNDVIKFPVSGIYEIDEMTDAITQLQINVQSFSSQVSKMISIADVGLGTFMYDTADDSVFVGQSFTKLFKLPLPQDEDVILDRKEFLKALYNEEVRSVVSVGLKLAQKEERKDYSEVYQIHRISGGIMWLRVAFIYSNNSAIGIIQDITETIMEKERIEYERDYDSLTGLLNRHAYNHRLEALFRDKSKLGVTAFMMTDLDHLKYVNDTYGHDFGDDYIKTAASVLKKFQQYGGIVARISGDEFNVCLPGFPSQEAARKVIHQVREELLQSSCLLADGTHFKLRASSGVAWYPADADSFEQLMKYADFAMYTIKHSSKGGLAEFDMTTYSADSVLLTGVEEMNRIIEEQAVRYAFQMIMNARTGEVYGYEALMRVQSTIFRSPLELLRTAKTSAKLYEIERLTWMKSLADFQALDETGKVEAGSRLFINSIVNTHIEQDDAEVLKATYGHLFSRMVVEILESEQATEEHTSRKLDVINRIGCQVALDDFGTGYNSEYALLSIQPDIIKIDHSIINGCDKDASRRMVIDNLVKLARSKGIMVLAEGVETLDEVRTVINCGVDLLQGYYLAYPLFEPEVVDPEVTALIRKMAEEAGG